MTRVPRLRMERVNLTFLESNTGFSAFRIEDIHGFFRAKHRLFGSQGSTRVLSKAQVGRTAQSSIHAQVVGWNGRGTLSRLILAVLFACTRVNTCHPWNCMRSIQHAFLPIWQSLVLPRELRIKRHIHIIHVSFWNNNKILFPGLKPLGLALRLNT
jgi:hypothetical protein